jgi:hypothetical protein
MTTITEYLKSYSIPFNKNLNKKIASMYVTPNAVILNHSFSAVSRGSSFYRLVDRINSIDNMIYLVLDKITTESEYNHFYTVLSTKVNIENVIIITDINDILNIPGIMEYSFGIHHCGAIWSLVMVDMHEMIQGRYIYVPRSVYNRAIAIMDDSELERLYTYNIVVSDDFYPNLVYIIQDTHNNKEPFTAVIRFTPLDGGQRSAIRIIENMTIQCPNCNKIVYIDKNHKCT